MIIHYFNSNVTFATQNTALHCKTRLSPGRTPQLLCLGSCSLCAHVLMPRAPTACQHTFPSVPQQENWLCSARKRIMGHIGDLADEQIGKLAVTSTSSVSILCGCGDAVLHGAPFRRRSSAPIAAENCCTNGQRAPMHWGHEAPSGKCSQGGNQNPMEPSKEIAITTGHENTTGEALGFVGMLCPIPSNN